MTAVIPVRIFCQNRSTKRLPFARIDIVHIFCIGFVLPSRGSDSSPAAALHMVHGLPCCSSFNNHESTRAPASARGRPMDTGSRAGRRSPVCHFGNSAEGKRIQEHFRAGGRCRISIAQRPSVTSERRSLRLARPRRCRGRAASQPSAAPASGRRAAAVWRKIVGREIGAETAQSWKIGRVPVSSCVTMIDARHGYRRLSRENATTDDIPWIKATSAQRCLRLRLNYRPAQQGSS